eukprot:jgi/Hompol1/4054/HPOL_006897-RA
MSNQTALALQGNINNVMHIEHLPPTATHHAAEATAAIPKEAVHPLLSRLEHLHSDETQVDVGANTNEIQAAEILAAEILSGGIEAPSKLRFEQPHADLSQATDLNAAIETVLAISQSTKASAVHNEQLHDSSAVTAPVSAKKQDEEVDLIKELQDQFDSVPTFSPALLGRANTLKSNSPSKDDIITEMPRRISSSLPASSAPVSSVLGINAVSTSTLTDEPSQVPKSVTTDSKASWFATLPGKKKRASMPPSSTASAPPQTPKKKQSISEKIKSFFTKRRTSTPNLSAE